MMRRSRSLVLPLDYGHLLVVLGLLSAYGGYGQEEILRPKDFSKSNAVSRLLAEGERWDPEEDDSSHGNGLEMALWQTDGRTSVTNVAGKLCRCLTLEGDGRREGYLYFALDPTFKSQDTAHVKIEVEYFDGFDGQMGVFGIQYDTTGSGAGLNPAYRQFHQRVPLNGSKKWLSAVFHVAGGTFRNAQNGGSDFRLWASPPQLCVRQVTVTREAAQNLQEQGKLLAFNAAGEASLGDWSLKWDSAGKPSFFRGSDPQPGPRWLEISAPGMLVVGSWRATVLLAAGEYQFVGKVRTAGVDATAGVSLRMSYRPARKILNAAPDWTVLTYDFSMT